MIAQTGHILREKVEKIVAAIDEDAVSSSEAWNALDALSSNTTIDDVDIDPDAIIIENDGSFRGSLGVYVTLRYSGQADEDSMETSESFPAVFHGHFDGADNVIIDNIKVDTRAFYGEAYN